MVRFYVNRIQKCKLTIEQVPERWRAAVQKDLDAENQKMHNK